MTVIAYASIEDVLRSRRQPTTDPAYTSVIETYLVDAKRALDDAIGGYTFTRSPETGTEAWITTGLGCNVLHVHEGVFDIESIEIRGGLSDAWVELDSGYWALEGELGDPRIPAGEPAFHVALLPGSTYSRFPAGRQLVRITGARYWPAVPLGAKSASVSLVRSWLGADQTGQGGQFGPEEMGGRIGGELWPRIAYDFVQHEKNRFRGCGT